MQKILCKSTIAFLFLFSGTSVFTQPLNSSFEEWDSGDPVDWASSDDFLQVNGITQSSDAYVGTSSAQMEVVTFAGFVYPAWLWSIDDNGNYHPVSVKYEKLKGWYKFFPLGNDQLYIVVTMFDSAASPVGGGELAIYIPAANWTEFNIPINYSPGTPDPVQTLITIVLIDSSAQTNPGSSALIDHLSFTGPSSVEQLSSLPDDFSLSQNYPNPFNPSTNIEYSIPEASFVQLKVFDILGNEVAELVNQDQSAGTYRADFTANNLASGFYVAQLRAGDFSKTIKMTLLR